MLKEYRHQGVAQLLLQGLKQELKKNGMGLSLPEYGNCRKELTEAAAGISPHPPGYPDTESVHPPPEAEGSPSGVQSPLPSPRAGETNHIPPAIF